MPQFSVAIQLPDDFDPSQAKVRYLLQSVNRLATERLDERTGPEDR